MSEEQVLFKNNSSALVGKSLFQGKILPRDKAHAASAVRRHLDYNSDQFSEKLSPERKQRQTAVAGSRVPKDRSPTRLLQVTAQQTATQWRPGNANLFSSSTNPVIVKPLNLQAVQHNLQDHQKSSKSDLIGWENDDQESFTAYLSPKEEQF